MNVYDLLRALFDRIDQAEQFVEDASRLSTVLHARLNTAEAERDKAQRAAQTLGKVIDDQCRDIARITRSEHLVSEDGDADWGLIWERGYSLADERDTARAQVQAVHDWHVGTDGMELTIRRDEEDSVGVHLGHENMDDAHATTIITSRLLEMIDSVHPGAVRDYLATNVYDLAREIADNVAGFRATDDGTIDAYRAARLATPGQVDGATDDRSALAGAIAEKIAAGKSVPLSWIGAYMDID